MNTKVLLKTLVIVLAVCLLITGCTKPQVEGTVTATAEATPTIDPSITPAPAHPYPYKVEDINSVQYAFDTQQMAQPYWLGNVMYNESICMIQREDGAINGSLLFTPTRIVSVYDNSLKKLYVEGKDYKWEQGTKTITWLDGSDIKYFTQNDIEGKDENGEQIKEYPTWDSLQRSRFGNQLYCIGPFLYEKQIAVTYTYDETEWKGYNATFKGQYLPKTMEKFKNLKDTEDDFTLVIYGDSIFTGCDSSSIYGREPKTPTFFKLVEKTLEEHYGISVKTRNPSKGGEASPWGKANADKLVADRAPDLVIIGFGMNGGSGVQNSNDVKAMMETIKAKNPDCEFIVCSCMVPNKNAGFLTTQGQLAGAFKKLEGEGVAFFDMFATHNEILKTKDFIATSGNNINHPNDWLARVYAMQILATLIDYTA